MARAHSAQSDIIADEYLKFVTTFKDRTTYLGNWDKRIDAARTKCFEIEFGIRGKDGNLYPFTLCLFYCEALWNGSDRIHKRYFLTLHPSENFSGVLVEEEVHLNKQKFSYKGPLIQKGPNGQRCLQFTKWEVFDDDLDLTMNETCHVQVRIKIQGLSENLNVTENRAFLVGNDEDGDGKKPKLKFLQHTTGNFRIIGQDKVIGTTNMKKFLTFLNGSGGRKEFYVDKDRITKESGPLKSMAMENSKTSKKIVLPDTNSQILEGFLIFCYTGFLPMSTFNENLAKFMDNYKVENMRGLLDKFVSMSLTARDTGIWTKWAPKLNLRNTALKIWLLKRGSEEVWTRICKRDKDFAAYVGLVVGTATAEELFPVYGQLGELDFSENIMIS